MMLTAVCLCLTAAVAACSSTTPVADGPTLLKTRCATCHSPERGKTVRKTRAEWEQTMSKMIAKGAKINGAEKDVLVEYLAGVTAQ
jgi:hypothetical protein